MTSMIQITQTRNVSRSSNHNGLISNDKDAPTLSRFGRRRRGRRSDVALTRSSYGESKKDGTWIQSNANAFNQLISIAKRGNQREIVQAGDRALIKVSREVSREEIDSTVVQDLVEEMMNIVKGRGVGLAAPQIGVNLRVFVMEDTVEGMSDETKEDLQKKKRQPFLAKAIINPEITAIGDASAAFFEGCLSVQGYRALVRRHLRIRLRGVAPDGKEIDVELSGWPARIAQHEIDHLNGVLYTDRMEKRTIRRVDKIQEQLPEEHREFGTCAKIGERLSGGSYLSSVQAIEGVDALESLAKRSKNRRKR